MATFKVDGTKTKVSFEYEALTAKIQSVVSDCAESLFKNGRGDHGSEEEPIVFADLSNTEKLDIVDDYIKDIIVNRANQFKLDEAKDAVEITKHVL